ncbi:hypothetical protein C5S42_00815 [Candidatus Methanomarinus sp.]|nr:hypothetical protein C5S42_00815 [ANME-2 cluster archaeon]
MNLEISEIIFFGQPGLTGSEDEGRIYSLEPPNSPKDYENQMEIEELLKNRNIDCPIKYVDVSNNSRETRELVEKYIISGVHTWVLVFNNGKYKRYENENEILKCIDSIYKYNDE